MFAVVIGVTVAEENRGLCEPLWTYKQKVKFKKGSLITFYAAWSLFEALSVLHRNAYILPM